MKFKYLVLICIIGSITFYIYSNDGLYAKFLGKAHQMVPEINNSTLYKWQNKLGEWQITDSPPIKGITFSTITTQDQINVLPSPSSNKLKK